MFFSIKGINSEVPLNKVFKGVPHHKVDILDYSPVESFDINKKIIEGARNAWPFEAVFVGKSYGAFLLAEANIQDKKFCVSLPIWYSGKKYIPELQGKKNYLIYSSDDELLRDIEKEDIYHEFSKTFIVDGDHSLRPLDCKKIERIKKIINTYSKTNTRKTYIAGHKESNKSISGSNLSESENKLHLDFSFLSDAKVDLLLSTKNYQNIPLERAKKYLPESYHYFLNKEVGIITHVVKRHTESIYCFQTNTLDVTKLNSVVETNSVTGGFGVGLTKRQAMKKAVFETLERYSLSTIPRDYVEMKYSDIPDVFKYTAEGLSFYETNSSFSNALEDKIHWTKIQKWKSDEQKLYPCQLINPSNMGYRVKESTSTGSALGRDMNDAVLRGCEEVMERHLNVSWFYDLDNVKAKKITNIESKNDLYVHVRKKFDTLHTYLIKKGKLQVITIIAVKNGRFAIGSGFGTYKAAINSALREVIITDIFADKLRHLIPKTKDDISSLVQNYLYYQDKSDIIVSYLDRISKDNVSVNRRDINTEDEIRKQGHEIFYKDITAPRLRKTHLRATKSIIPGTLDLLKSYSKPPKKHRLLRNTKLPNIPMPFP